MIEDYKTVRVKIHTKRADSKKPNWDEEWELWWDDELTLSLDKTIERERRFPYKGKHIQTAPREFAALLRALADEIDP